MKHQSEVYVAKELKGLEELRKWAWDSYVGDFDFKDRIFLNELIDEEIQNTRKLLHNNIRRLQDRQIKV